MTDDDMTDEEFAAAVEAENSRTAKEIEAKDALIQELLAALVELRYACTDKAERMADAAIAKAATGEQEAMRRPPGKVTQHWLGVALERVCAGEDEADVLADYGWTRAP